MVNGQGTIITPFGPGEEFRKSQEANQTKVDEEARINCIRGGGKWNAATKTCSTDVKIDKPKEEPKPTPPNPPGTIITNADTGEVSGFINSEGNFVKGSKGDVAAATEPDAITGVQFQEQQRLQRQIANIGNLENLSPAVQAAINKSQALTAGVAGAIPGIIGGAIGGATIGALGGPIGAVGGAILGGLGTAIKGIIGNVKEQQRGELQAADIELRNARTLMRIYAMNAAQDPANADVYISQFNQQLTRIHQARRQTKAEVTGDLNAWIEDGREQLADFDAFVRPGGIADAYGDKLRIALATGVTLTEADFILGEEIIKE